MDKDYTLEQGDCCELIKGLPDGSIDCVVTDPPYLYLKHRLDRPFDEDTLFSEIDRVLKPDGMIAMFGRGESLYRWCNKLSDLGMTYKEDIIWNKRYTSSPVLPLLRVHENCVIYSKGNGKIRKRRVPYLEAKEHDIDSIVNDIKRVSVILNNEKELKKVQQFLEMNKGRKEELEQGGKYECIYDVDNHCQGISVSQDIKLRSRVIDTTAIIKYGAVEKDIIVMLAKRYSSIHPTQKPVRLMERIMALISDEGDTVLDPFAGSGSTAVAAINTGRKCIAYEIDDEYYQAASNRLEHHTVQPRLL